MIQPEKGCAAYTFHIAPQQPWARGVPPAFAGSEAESEARWRERPSALRADAGGTPALPGFRILFSTDSAKLETENYPHIHAIVRELRLVCKKCQDS
jgi:hypothetical protein